MTRVQMTMGDNWENHTGALFQLFHIQIYKITKIQIHKNKNTNDIRSDSSGCHWEYSIGALFHLFPAL